MSDPIFVALKKEELNDVATRIKVDFPHSASVYNSLKLHAEGAIEVYQYYVLKSDPSSRIVLYKAKTPKMFITLGFHVPNDQVETFQEALRNTELLDWKDPFCFFHVSQYLLESVLTVGREKGLEKMTNSPGELFVFEPPLEKEPLWKTRCPQGYGVQRLGKKGVEKLFDLWRYKCCADVFEYHTLADKAPAMGIYPRVSLHDTSVEKFQKADDDSFPVAWCMISPHGSLGMLKVDPEYTEKELDKVVVDACAYLFLELGFVPHIHADGKEEIELFNGLQDWKKMYSCHWVSKV